MRFYMPADKKYLHEPEIQYFIETITKLQEMKDK